MLVCSLLNATAPAPCGLAWRVSKNNTIDESIGHLDTEIDRADLEGLEGMKIGNIMLQVTCFVFPDGLDAIELSSERFLTDIFLLKV